MLLLLKVICARRQAKYHKIFYGFRLRINDVVTISCFLHKSSESTKDLKLTFMLWHSLGEKHHESHRKNRVFCSLLFDWILIYFLILFIYVLGADIRLMISVKKIQTIMKCGVKMKVRLLIASWDISFAAMHMQRT